MSLHDFAGRVIRLNGWRKPFAKNPHRLQLSADLGAPRPPKASLNLDWLKIEDQSWLGDCTCNSSTSAIEYVIRKETGVIVDLSRLWLYAMVRLKEGTPLSEDSGAMNESVFEVLQSMGCPLEALYPYDLEKWQEAPSQDLDPEALKHKLALRYELPTLESIKACIAQGFPAVIGIAVFKSMMTEAVAQSGDWKTPSGNDAPDGGHSTMLAAYDDERRKVLIPNSWGTDVGVDMNTWGATQSQRGFFEMDYGFFEQGFVDDCHTPRLVA